MTLQSPLWMQANTYPAALDRRLITASFGAAGGIAGIGDLKVSQRGAGANNTVDIAAGIASVPGAVANYLVYNDAPVNLGGFASPPSAGNLRNDLIVVTCRDAETAGPNNDSIFQIITGAPAGSPIDPAVPAYSLPLARVVWTSSSVSVVNSMITDLRLAGVRPSSIAAALPTLSRPGQILGTTDGLAWIWNGSGWSELERVDQVAFDYSTIADHNNQGATAATYGSLTIPNPGRDVLVSTIVSCNAVTVGPGQSDPGLAVQISTDGGTTFPTHSPTLAQNSPNTLSGVSLIQFLDWAGVPSGDIVVRGRIISAGLNSNFTDGSMKISVIPA